MLRNHYIQIAQPSDLADITSLLLASKLPTEDVGMYLEDFLIALNGEELMGCIGLEIFDNEGLLRSLVVKHSQKNQGLGRQLVSQLERYAYKQKIQKLFLLTTTASLFFKKCGYLPINRVEVPSSIKQTLSFQSLCPASAEVLYKDLRSSF